MLLKQAYFDTTTLRRMAYSIMTLCITVFIVILIMRYMQNHDTQHKESRAIQCSYTASVFFIVMLNVDMLT
jgi:hypothetical protein